MGSASGKLYLKLMAGVGVALALVGGVGLVAMRQNLPWQQAFVGLLFGVFAVLALVAFTGILVIAYELYRGSSSSSLAYRFASGALHLLYRPALILGRIFGVDKDRIRSSFIQLHNQLAGRLPVRVPAEKVLVLAPVCLQLADCPRKVTVDVDNCARCGRCRVDDLLRLREQYGVHVAVATGGTFARKLLRDLRPKAVVAVACERDLVSGLQDSRPLLVLGVTNERPHGPCFNTTVNIELVERAICRLLGRAEGAEVVSAKVLVQHRSIR